MKYRFHVARIKAEKYKKNRNCILSGSTVAVGFVHLLFPFLHHFPDPGGRIRRQESRGIPGNAEVISIGIDFHFGKPSCIGLNGNNGACRQSVGAVVAPVDRGSCIRLDSQGLRFDKGYREKQ